MAEHHGKFSLAQSEDSADLLTILEDTSFSGKISLLYTRRPDAWASLQREGKKVFVYRYAERDPDGSITVKGFGACALNPVLIDGQLTTLGYLFSFRILHGAEAALRHFPEGYRFHFQACAPTGTTHFLTTILEDNRAARQLFEKKRASLPLYDYIGTINTFNIRTGGRSRLPTRWVFRKARSADIENLLRFFSAESRRYQYFPVLKREDLLEGRTCPSINDFYLLLKPDGEIAACGAAWDQRSYKPYLISGYSGVYRWLRPLSALLCPILQLPNLPPPGSTLNFCVLGFFLAAENRADIANRFLRNFKSHNAQYNFFALGLHEKHPLLPTLSRLSPLVYRSRLYRVFQKHEEKNLFTGLPYIEIGRL